MSFQCYNRTASEYAAYAHSNLTHRAINGDSLEKVVSTFYLELCYLIDDMANGGTPSKANIRELQIELLASFDFNEINNITNAVIKAKKEGLKDEKGKQLTKYTCFDLMRSVGVFERMAAGDFDRCFAAFSKLDRQEF